MNYVYKPNEIFLPKIFKSKYITIIEKDINLKDWELHNKHKMAKGKKYKNEMQKKIKYNKFFSLDKEKLNLLRQNVRYLYKFHKEKNSNYIFQTMENHIVNTIPNNINVTETSALNSYPKTKNTNIPNNIKQQFINLSVEFKFMYKKKLIHELVNKNYNYKTQYLL